MTHSCGHAHCHARITNTDPHAFSLALGDVEIIRLYDTTLLGETAQSWLPDFDRARVAEHEHWLAPTHYDPESGRIPMPVHSWIVRTGRHTVLIDSCIGNHKDRPGLPEMHRLSTRYLDRMRALGIQPEEIDYVMCSHLHADHVGWNTQLVNGVWVPTFPNARYVISQIEHDHLLRAIRGEGPAGPAWFKPMYNDSVLPVVEAGQATMFDDTYELDETFLIRHAPGHSPGHVRIELTSQGSRGVFSGDMLHSPIQIPFWQWSSKVCDDRALAAKSRFELLAHCVEHGALLLPGHFEAPHAGHIVDAVGTFGIEFLK